VKEDGIKKLIKVLKQNIKEYTTCVAICDCFALLAQDEDYRTQVMKKGGFRVMMNALRQVAGKGDAPEHLACLGAVLSAVVNLTQTSKAVKPADVVLVLTALKNHSKDSTIAQYAVWAIHNFVIVNGTYERMAIQCHNHYH
jgi:hypothetical protein